MPDMAASSVPASDEHVNRPLTLPRLFVFLVKGFFKSIPSMLVWTIVRTVLLFVAVLVIHTFFVVYKNDGFWPDPSNPVYRLIAFPETRTEALAFWSIAAFLLTSLAGRIWFGGILKLIRDFIDTPIWIIDGFQHAKKAGLGAFLSGLLLSVALSFLIASPYLLFVLMISLFFSITLREQGLWFLFLTTAWSDIRKLFGKEKRADHRVFTVLLLGFLIGLLLSLIVPFGIYGKILLILISIAGIVLTRVSKLRPKTLLWAGLLLTVSALVFRVTSIYADDGGWYEAGANFTDWWRSTGRGEAVNMGVLPGLVSLLGALLGGSNVPKPPPIPDVMTNRPETWEWHREGEKWVLYQTHGGRTYGTGIPESIFTLDPELIGPRIRIYTEPTSDNSAAVNRINEGIANLGPTYMNRFTRAGWNNLSPAERVNSLQAVSRVLAEAAGVKPGSFTLRVQHEADRGSYGAWNSGNRVLEINSNSQIYDNPLKVIQTMSHELRHAAQSDTSADLGGSNAYRDLITWNDKNENYQQAGTDYTRYAGQLLERDAEAFGNDISRAFIQQVIRVRYGTE